MSYVYSDYQIKVLLVSADLNTDLPLDEWTIGAELARCGNHVAANAIAAAMVDYVGSLKDEQDALGLVAPCKGFQPFKSWKDTKVISVMTRKAEEIIEPASHKYSRVEAHLVKQVSAQLPDRRELIEQKGIEG